MQHYSLDNLKKISRDNRSFIFKMIELFISTVRPSLASIHAGAAENDSKKVFLNIHKIKSNLKYFEMNDIEDDVALLEKLAREQAPIESLQPIIDRIGPIIQSTLNALIIEKEQFS